ncbi:phosphoenolpyruvate synthase [Marinobacteraceae bacterium S3BR75-40.1]
MNNLVCPALEASALSEAELGGKARQMAWLSRNDFPVPEWVAVTTEAFDAFLQEHDLKGWLSTTLKKLTADNAAATSAAIAERIEEHSLPLVLVSELAQALGSLDLPADSFYAVRSSVVGEDAGNASFAGQMDSFLFQQTLEDIHSAIRRVWASAFSERALLYRMRHGLPLEHIQCAVIVQRMIDGEVSGVMFTAHPVNGHRDQGLISACWGSGEGLVSGICAADEFTVGLDGGILEQQIADKDQALRFDREQGRGTREVEVPAEERHTACLSPEQCRQLMRVGRAIARKCGAPQDIEWTYADGGLWVLQTRPITALPAPARPKGECIVWDNSNIQESYCGVTTPLTFSFARRAYATVYEQTMRILGLPERTIQGHRDMLDNMLGLIRGRVYYNINNWYRGLTLLPGFGNNKEAMERMMGLQDPVDFIQDQERSGLQKLREMPAMFRALAGLLLSFLRMERKVKAFHGMFETEYQAFPRHELHTLEFAELMDWARRLDRNLLHCWTTPILNDFYVMMSNQQVHKWLEKAGVEGIEAVQNNLMSGEEGIESTEPTKFLLALADRIRKDPELTRLVRETPDERLMAVLQAQWPDVYRQCLDYIERYGDRTMGELKLESQTLRHDPAFMFQILRNFLLRGDLSLDRLARNEQVLREEAESTAYTAVRNGFGERGLKRFRKAVQRLRAAVKHRENMRLARTRMFGLYRDIYETLGQRLHEAGELNDARDIFYVTVEELDGWMNGTFVGGLAPTAEVRKAEFASYEGEDLPHHFFTYGPVYHHNTPVYPYQAEDETLSSGSTLKGIGCYPGIVEQPVRLIFSPKDELSLDGQILCTVRTDPGWAPLFPTAGGLLIERGSTLSHSAVVARELGIPAVVNVPGITQRLQNGERVRIDGSSGEVRLLEREDSASPETNQEAVSA